MISKYDISSINDSRQCERERLIVLLFQGLSGKTITKTMI